MADAPLTSSLRQSILGEGPAPEPLSEWTGLHEAYEGVPPWLGFDGETRGRHPQASSMPLGEFSPAQWGGDTYPSHQWSEPVSPFDVTNTMGEYAADLESQRALKEDQDIRRGAPSGLVMNDQDEREILHRDPYGQWYREGEEAVYQPDALLYQGPSATPGPSLPAQLGGIQPKGAY